MEMRVVRTFLHWSPKSSDGITAAARSYSAPPPPGGRAPYAPSGRLADVRESPTTSAPGTPPSTEALPLCSSPRAQRCEEGTVESEHRRRLREIAESRGPSQCPCDEDVCARVCAVLAATEGRWLPEARSLAEALEHYFAECDRAPHFVATAWISVLHFPRNRHPVEAVVRAKAGVRCLRAFAPSKNCAEWRFEFGSPRDALHACIHLWPYGPRLSAPVARVM